MMGNPLNKLFASCSGLPSITTPTSITGSCTLDSPSDPAIYVANGIDVKSGSNNIGQLILGASSSITINAGTHLLVGSITIPDTSIGSFISIQPAVTSPVLAAGEIDINSSTLAPFVTASTSGARRLALMISSSSIDCNDSNASTYAHKTCYADADGDGYTVASGTSQCSGSTCPSGYKDTPSTKIDCNDTDVNVWDSTPGTCYQDADNDGYGSQTSSAYTCFNATTCTAATAGSVGTATAVTSTHFSSNNTDCKDTGTNPQLVWVTASCYIDADNDGEGGTTSRTCMDNANCSLATAGSLGSGGVAATGNFSSTNTDCCDTDANAHTGQTAFFTTPDACTTPAYDYDCSGTAVLSTLAPFNSSTAYSCTNPCSGCSTTYTYVPGWTSTMPASCGATATQTIGTGAYTTPGTCAAVACAWQVITTTPIARGCH
jgi:hypothetical protein